jgi:transposase InsO family protein
MPTPWIVEPFNVVEHVGPDFISRVLDQWAYANGVQLVFSRPGKPTDNAYIESFNGRLRQEYLNTQPRNFTWRQ